MIKRLTILLILVSMFLHCASRIGVLSVIYKERHRIALSLGLIDEVPIALCNSDHDFDRGLIFQETSDAEHSVPPLLSQAPEIQLFCTSVLNPQINVDRFILSASNPFIPTEGKYTAPHTSVFHPPSSLG